MTSGQCGSRGSGFGQICFRVPLRRSAFVLPSPHFCPTPIPDPFNHHVLLSPEILILPYAGRKRKRKPTVADLVFGVADLIVSLCVRNVYSQESRCRRLG
jgi:hypothetical protein